MTKPYGYGKRVRSYYSALSRRYLYWILALVFIVGALAGVALYDLYHSNSSEQPISSITNRVIAGNTEVFKTPYFKFQDGGKWVLSGKETKPASQYVYYKYNGLNIEHRLSIYINQVPPPLYLASSRAISVYKVNDNSFDIANISGPCAIAYGQGELHKVKEVSISQTRILCDPDTPQYTYLVGEVDGDYRLKLKSGSGAPIQIVISYRDMALDPNHNTIKNVVSSFEVL
jgi:hypothetical protein